MHDDGGASERIHRDLLGEVGADPLVHVRIIGPLRPSDAAHAEAATRELSTDGAAEEPGGTRYHRDGARGGRCCCGWRRAAGRSNDTTDVCRELLVDGRDASQVLATERRATARRGRAVELSEQLRQPGIVGAAD